MQKAFEMFVIFKCGIHCLSCGYIINNQDTYSDLLRTKLRVTFHSHTLENGQLTAVCRALNRKLVIALGGTFGGNISDIYTVHLVYTEFACFYISFHHPANIKLFSVPVGQRSYHVIVTKALKEFESRKPRHKCPSLHCT